MNSVVSVIISTYNSSAFIIETLESISNQSWKDLELIISDDCSKDDTVEVCRIWLNTNSKRFANSVMLKSEKNTGVSGNANRGLKSASGDWIKFLGADDTLMPDCIKNNMQFIASNPETRVLFSKVRIYQDTFEEGNLVLTTPDEINQKSIIWPEMTVESQFRSLLLSDRVHFSPSVFLHRETLLSVGGFDERFKLLEDYPLWLNLTRNGHKLYYMDSVTVNYRRHSKAINNTGSAYLVNPNYFKSENFRKIYTYPFLPFDVRMNQRINWFTSQIFRIKGLNKDNKMNRFLLALLTTYLNPFAYYIFLKKRITYIKEKEFYF